MLGWLRARRSPAPAVLLLAVALFGIHGWMGLPETFATRPAQVFVVGDSITAQGTDELRRLHRGWDIDGVSGRRVSELPRILDDRLARGPAPRAVVVALGTNSVSWWAADDYRSALARLPASTRVVLVTTYRDPDAWPEDGPEPHRAAVLADYSRWLGEIAQERPGTCLVDWRTTVQQRPGLLADGVHPTQEGQRVWAAAISRSVATCQ